MTNDVAELARVTCEEYYDERQYGMDPALDPDLEHEARKIADAEEAAARGTEPECVHCGDYGYLGVEDELCTSCEGPETTWAFSGDLFEDMRDIPF